MSRARCIDGSATFTTVLSSMIMNSPNATAAIVEAANLTRLSRLLGCSDYNELHRVSIEEPERFWPALVDDLGLTFTRRWAHVLDTSDGIEWARWFVDGRVNVASNCVHKWAELPGEAAVFVGEDGTRSALTWPELSRQTTQVAEALLALGVEPGDRVAIFMPMSPAVAVASHACAHVGAVQVPIFSGFAAPAIRARLEDAQAKVVIAADRSLRRGKPVEMLAVLREANTAGARELVWSRAEGWPEKGTRPPGT